MLMGMKNFEKNKEKYQEGEGYDARAVAGISEKEARAALRLREQGKI